ncbi:MAG: hypothetical protein QXJ62_07275 [Nitrososphaeria archaeon]
MLEKDEFERWIKSSHAMFEIFEGRYNVYPLSVLWIKEWFDSGSFTVIKEHLDRISILIKNFDYKVYSVKGEIKVKIDQEFKGFVEISLSEGKNENIGFAVAPCLFTWNFRRFKEYFKRKEDFNIQLYFKSLSTFLKGKIEQLKEFRNKRLISDQIEKRKIEKIFHEVNSKLKEIGIKNNEPVGTIKLLHVFAPYYFPLIDNDIAKAIGRLVPSKWESLTSNSYLKWMDALKSWLQNYGDIIEKLEKGHNSSILKLVDEELYMMSTVKLRSRVAKLKIEVK